MRIKPRNVLAVALAAVVLAGALGVMLMGRDAAAAPRVEPDEIDLGALRRVEPELWAALREKRILFGHQSVGANVVSGLESILTRMPEIGLRIVESRDPEAFATPGFVHTGIGRNEDAASKLADFSGLLRGPLGERADFAIMKFCYAELKEGGDPNALFDDYRETITGLADARPGIRFIHVTMPLTTVEAGPKARVKSLLGRPLRGYSDNIPRNRYNQLLRDAYPATDLFDLAAAEARLPDGRLARFTSGDESWSCLSTAYARDRGHPNEAGELAAARDLLLVLAEQCR